MNDGLVSAAPGTESHTPKVQRGAITCTNHNVLLARLRRDHLSQQCGVLNNLHKTVSCLNKPARSSEQVIKGDQGFFDCVVEYLAQLIFKFALDTHVLQQLPFLAVCDC